MPAPKARARDDANKASTTAPGLSTMSTAATQGDTSSTSSTIQGVSWTLEALVQAAQPVVQGTQQSQSGESSSEKTKPEIRTIIKDVRVSSTLSQSMALVDSGATLPVRAARK